MLPWLYLESLYFHLFRSVWVSVGQCGSVWVSVGHCGSVLVSVGQCRSVWVSVGQGGSFSDKNQQVHVWVSVHHCR